MSGYARRDADRFAANTNLVKGSPSREGVDVPDSMSAMVDAAMARATDRQRRDRRRWRPINEQYFRKVLIAKNLSPESIDQMLADHRAWPQSRRKIGIRSPLQTFLENEGYRELNPSVAVSTEPTRKPRLVSLAGRVVVSATIRHFEREAIQGNMLRQRADRLEAGAGRSRIHDRLARIEKVTALSRKGSLRRARQRSGRLEWSAPQLFEVAA